MQISSVHSHWVSAQRPDVRSADQAQEALVVVVETDSGLVGLGECNHSPLAAQAFLDAPSSSSQTRNVRELLVGRELSHPADIHRELLRQTQSNARRGIGRAVLSALDVALWDLWAQAQGVPLWKTLFGDAARPPRAYATLYTGPGDYAETVACMSGLMDCALTAGFTAVKVEPLEECVPEPLIAEFVADARFQAGERVELLVDVYHRFGNARSAARSIDAFAYQRPYLVETPLPLDEVAAYAKLVRLTDVPVAASELLESSSEFDVLLRFGDVPIAQPWPNRLGVTGTLEVVDLCRRLGRRCVLAGWNATAIGVALNVHLAAGLGEGVVLEHAPATLYDTFVLRPVAGPEPDIRDGHFELSDDPGLGLRLDQDRLCFFSPEQHRRQGTRAE